jgi:Flp pilus assembly protein TadG
MRLVGKLLHDEDGGPAAEFALVLPLALLFMFGIIDVGRYMWAYNQAEKATQMGARYAVATNIVAKGLTNYSFATSCGVLQGNSINPSQFGQALCTSNSCSVTASCSGIPSGSAAAAYDGTAFNNIVGRMQAFKGDILPAQVTVNYVNSGLGYAGDPNGLDVSPLVTIRVTGLTFQPITTLLFNSNLTMGPFSYSLTMEDGSGTFSN